MTNTIKTLLTASAITIASITSAQASTHALFSKDAKSGGIYSETIITPNNKELDLSTVSIHYGASAKHPGQSCTNKQTYPATYKGDDTVDPGTQHLSSRNLINIVGKNQQCLQIDMTTYAGKTYSTGKILLVWDNAKGKYVSAAPAKGTIDFTK